MSELAIQDLEQHHGQLDEDGCSVAVSRQALNETLDYVDSLRQKLEEIKFALQVEEHDNKYNCNKIDKLEAENARLKGLYGIIDGQKIIIKELEDKVKELTEWKPTAPQIEGK